MKWLKVPGYLVEITRNGKCIRNSLTKKIVKQYKDKNGYKRVSIKEENGRRTYKGVHQLVTKLFLGKCPKNKEVNHKDLSTSNNHYKNLEYVTSSENKFHAIKNGVNWGNKTRGKRRKGGGISYGEKHGKAKLTWEQIINIKFLYLTGLYTQKDLAKKFKVHQGTIWQIINKKTWVR